MYSNDSEKEKSLIECAKIAATCPFIPTSAGYAIARDIWALYFESKRKEINDTTKRLK